MTGWQRVCDLFAELRRMPPEARSRRLEEKCPDEPELHSELRSLLEADERVNGFLDRPLPSLEPIRPSGESPTAEEAAPGLRKGDHLGPYRLLRRLGRGGMGTVWLGRREDDTFTKRVAIKILRRGLVEGEARQRFRAERQILAALDHPYIAGIVDGGSAPDGRPYLVMEYVEGTSVGRYCAEAGLGLRQRLELFRKICSAVHFAHRNLVVHRDLKASNILVTADGTPKLLDFGIAKLLNPELSAAPPPAAGRTLHLTPEYASPELVRGGPITTASDVYSLGVLLYRLLTGSLPHTGPRGPTGELLRAVCRGEPRPPSLRLASGATEGDPDAGREVPPIAPRRLAGDLDHVVLKALARDPARRYGSVEELSQDLRRHLEDRPVAARKGTWLYRTGKFVRRHRWRVAAVAGLLAFAVAFGATMARQHAELARAQERAEEVRAFLVELFESADPLHGGTPDLTVRELLDAGTEKLRDRLAAQPDLRAELEGTLGEIYLRMGLPEEALPLVEASLEDHRRIHGRRHAEIARGLTRLGRLQVARGNFEAAESSLTEALEMRRGLLGEHHRETADGYNELGFLRHHQGRFEEAAELYRRALGLWREGTRRDGGRGSRAEIARTLNNLAALLTQTGELEEAEALHRRAIPLRSREYGPASAELSESLHNLAYLLRLRGRWDEARTLASRALEIRRRTLGEDHPRTAHALSNLAGIHQDLGQLERAEELRREALAIHRRRDRSEPGREVALALHSLALVIEEQGRLGEAEALQGQALEGLERLLGPDHPAVARVRASLGRLLTARGRPDRGEALGRSAVEVLRRGLGADHVETARAESDLATALARLGRKAEARRLLAHALESLARSPDRRARPWRRSAEGTLAGLGSPVSRGARAAIARRAGLALR